ncbi:hypothetical protein RIVM261_075370 [Rivularia sp. IAM M-261]|nr:hypothetical protein RIVM261_075370 [Rivularia sp. IAM M-261]
MSLIHDKSIFLITSKDPENDNFGTGFVIKKDLLTAYVLTCSHVVRDVGGRDKVEIGIYSVTVIAQSPDGHADDLAVLKVESEVPLHNSILPLGNFGKSGSSFTIFGYWLYDKRNKQYRLEQIQGSLGKLVGIKSRHQPDSIDAWQLKINDDSTLQPGFSGSPVIDSKSCTVIGIVSHLEGQGRTGQAVSLVNLKKNWAEMPDDLLREEPYDLVAVRELMKYIFDQTGLSLFIAENFSSISATNLPFLVEIDFLINDCHQKNKISELLNYINRFAPKKYKIFYNRNPDSQYNFTKDKKLFRCCKHFRFLKFSKSRYRETDREVISQCEIELVFENLSKFPPEVREAAIGALAGALKISREEIKVLEVRKGSVKVRIEIPSISLDKLIELYEKDRNLMQQLGIIYVVEVFEESFYLENIRTLLIRGFTREELVTICYENFISIYDTITLNNTQSEIVDKIIEYICRESQISNFLELTRERKPDIYNNFSPYYKVPRRPGQVRDYSRQSRRRVNSYRLRRPEILIAGFIGIVVAALGFIVLIIGLSLILFSTGISAFGQVFLFLGLLILGDIVGRVVSRATRRAGGEVAGRVAAASYFVGLVLIPTLILIIALIRQLANGNHQEALLTITSLLGWISQYIFSDIFFGGASTSTGLIGGGFLAYRRAS